MRIAVLFLALFLGFSPAKAETLEHKEGDLTVTLTKKPCDVAHLIASLSEEERKTVFAGSAQFKTERWRLCWAPLGDTGIAYIIDEMGNSGTMDLKTFQPLGKTSTSPRFDRTVRKMAKMT